MSKLLKGKRVFIDTQVFRKARFGLSAPAFKKLADLCADRELILVTTAITRREIEAQILEVSGEIKSAIAKSGVIALSLGQPDPMFLGMPSSQVTEQHIAASLKGLVDDFFQTCFAETLDLPKRALTTVLDLYFERKPPFGSGKKKAEFPDALVLEALKVKGDVNRDVLYVISEDSDFGNACKECTGLELIPTLSHFLDRYNAHADIVKRIQATLRTNSAKVDDTLNEIVRSLSGEMRDCAGKVEFESVKIVDVLDSLVISCEENGASVEFVCFVEAAAWLEILPSGGSPPEYRRGEARHAVNITLEFRFDPDNPAVFEVESYWAPQTLTFSAHDAI